MPEDMKALLEMVGLQPVMVDGMNREAWIVPEAGVVLFSAGLDADRLASLTSEVLDEVMTDLLKEVI